MSTKTEDIVMGNAQDHSPKNESAEGYDKDGKFDESELDGYITVDNRIAPEIVNALRSNDRTARLDAATKLRHLVDKRKTTATQPIIDSGILWHLVEMVSLDDVDLHVHVNAVLSFIVAGSSEQTSAAVRMGAIRKFILLASSSSSDEARDDALIALGNIGVDSPDLREKLIREGGVKPLLDILGNPSEHKGSQMYWAASALKSITRYLKPGSAGYEVTVDIIPVLIKYIQYQTDETAGSLEFSLCALSYMLSARSTIDAILQYNIVPQLVQLCTAKHAPARHVALRCAGLIIEHSYDGTNRLVETGIIEAIRPCITSEDGQDRRRGCWAASNIAVGTIEQAKALMAAGFVPVLVKVVSDPEEDSKTRDHAAWALASLACTCGQRPHELLGPLLEATCLDGLLLSLALEDRSVVEKSLKGIRVFLSTWWTGKEMAIETLKVGEGAALLRACKLRPEPGFAQERLAAHTILKEYLKELSQPPRV